MGFKPMIQYCCICQAGRTLSCFSPRSEPHVLRFALTCDLRNLLTMLTRRSEVMGGTHWLLDDVLCMTLWKLSVRSLRPCGLFDTCISLCLPALPG